MLAFTMRGDALRAIPFGGGRLAADVVTGIRATGRGYNACVEKVLRDALARGKL